MMSDNSGPSSKRPNSADPSPAADAAKKFKRFGTITIPTKSQPPAAASTDGELSKARKDFQSQTGNRPQPTGAVINDDEPYKTQMNTQSHTGTIRTPRHIEGPKDPPHLKVGQSMMACTDGQGMIKDKQALNVFKKRSQLSSTSRESADSQQSESECIMTSENFEKQSDYFRLNTIINYLTSKLDKDPLADKVVRNLRSIAGNVPLFPNREQSRPNVNSQVIDSSSINRGADSNPGLMSISSETAIRSLNGSIQRTNSDLNQGIASIVNELSYLKKEIKEIRLHRLVNKDGSLIEAEQNKNKSSPKALNTKFAYKAEQICVIRDPNCSRNEIENHIFNHPNYKKEKLKVDFINLHRNGNAYVHCAKHEFRDPILSILKTKFQVLPMVPNTKYVRIGPVSLNVSPNEMVENLIQSNEFLANKRDDFRFFTRISKTSVKSTMVFEVKEPTGSELIKSGFVHSRCTKLKALPFTPLFQCHICGRFGHLAKHCVIKKKCCPNCSLEHSLRECQSIIGDLTDEKKACGNCKRAKRENFDSHASWETKCPIRNCFIQSLLSKNKDNHG